MTTQTATVDGPRYDLHGRSESPTTGARGVGPVLATGMPLAKRWQVRVVAERGADATPWIFTTTAVESAERAGVGVRCGDGRYELSFEVSAPDLALATRATMARWARLYELCVLPDWELVSVTVDHAGIDCGAAAASSSRRRAGSRSRRRSNPSTTTLSAVEDAQIDPIRTEGPARVGSSTSDRVLAGSRA